MDFIAKNSQSLKQSIGSLGNHVGNAVNAYNVFSMVKDKFYPEYIDNQNSKDLQMDDPMLYSCIYEGNQSAEQNKRKAFKTKTECIEQIDKFLDRIDVRLVFDNLKIAELFHSGEHRCLIIDLNEIAKNQQPLCLAPKQGKNPSAQLNESLGELADILFNYLKGEYTRHGIIMEYIFHFHELREILCKKLRRTASKQMKRTYQELVQNPKLYLGQQKQNVQLLNLSQLIQNPQISLIQCQQLIANFFRMHQNEFQDTMHSLNGYQITGSVLSKYQQSINDVYLFEIRSNLQRFYLLSPQQTTIIEQSCIHYFTQYLNDKTIQNGICNPEINEKLQYLIHQVNWSFNSAQGKYVISLLNRIALLNKPINKDLIQGWGLQQQNKELALEQFRLEHKNQCRQALEWWQTNIDEQTNILVIFQLYLLVCGFEFVDNQLSIDTYTPISRMILVIILRSLNNLKWDYVNMFILKILEHLTGKIFKQLLESIRQEHNIQIDNINKSQLSQADAISIKLHPEQQEIRLLLYQQNQQSQLQAQIAFFSKNCLLYLLQRPMDKQGDYIPKLQSYTQEFIQKKLKVIQQNFLPDVSPPEYLLFDLISQAQETSNVINLCISGFISEDEDKFNQWKGMISQYGANVVSLHWKCGSLKEFGSFFLKQVATAVITKAAFSSISALMSVLSVYSDNPFADAEKEAQRVGRYLAYLISEVKIFGDCQINIVCHSLGTLLTYECIRELDKQYEKTKQHYVNSIMLMGGVADCHKLAKRRWHCVAGQIYNIYSKKDQVLRTVLSAIKLFNTPCGRQRVHLGYRKVINCDFTSFIEGHSYYKKIMKQIMHQTDFDQDLKVLFEDIDLSD